MAASRASTGGAVEADVSRQRSGEAGGRLGTAVETSVAASALPWGPTRERGEREVQRRAGTVELSGSWIGLGGSVALSARETSSTSIEVVDGVGRSSG
ncbi:hypothetical protein AAVH_28451 [Aphelenchoides avenae]|nr:hypothetical protein AAVH_28451 [Aphelenchus avenae]